MRFLFRLVRLLIVASATFLAGILFERYHQHTLCDQSGGQWMRAGFCAGK